MRILTNISQAELGKLTAQPTAKAMIDKVNLRLPALRKRRKKRRSHNGAY